jgi:tRNA U34 5-carboxymethylaminomethyl modifying enzyme MnmG/GidA
MSELEESDDKVFVIMATNRLEMMDSAITRDGRFGVIIDVDLPNKDGCREIFDIHMRNKNPDENLDRDYIAQLLADKKTSGATIAGVIERAFKYSYRRCGIYDKMRAGTFVIDDLKDVKITMEDIKNAIDEVVYKLVYKGYLERDLRQIEKSSAYENVKIPESLDYSKVLGLRLEAGQKLASVRPSTVAQASRISGVSPADISVLLVHVKASGRGE